jgi:hypothetical protein
MSDAARRIGAENLEQRLPVANPRDELGQLAVTFNELLSRLNAAFAQQRRFMADASHELRTPLSVMNTTAQVTLEKARRDESEYRDAIAIMAEQTRRLACIVEDMFTLARVDAGRRKLHETSFYLDELIAETVRAARVLAVRKGVTVAFAHPAETPYFGDEGLLRQMVLNLLDNAIRHTPAAGTVSLQLGRQDSSHLITVADTGAGIPVEAQPHIFERFYRWTKLALALPKPTAGARAWDYQSRDGLLKPTRAISFSAAPTIGGAFSQPPCRLPESASADGCSTVLGKTKGAATNYTNCTNGPRIIRGIRVIRAIRGRSFPVLIAQAHEICRLCKYFSSDFAKETNVLRKDRV